VKLRYVHACSEDLGANHNHNPQRFKRVPHPSLQKAHQTQLNGHHQHRSNTSLTNFKKTKMKNLCRNFDVRAAIPLKLGTPTWKVLFPSRLWFPAWTCEEKKVKAKKCGGREGWIESAGKSAFGFGVSAALLCSVFSHSPAALAESLTVAFPVSRAPEVIHSLSLSLISFVIYTLIIFFYKLLYTLLYTLFFLL